MTDPRPARTRARLIAAAHRLITEKGVAALRIAEITEEARVAQGSFYNHFATREALVEAVVSETITALASEILGEQLGDDEPAVVAIAALRRFVRLAYEDPEFSRLLVNLSHGEELFVEAITPFARDAIELAIADGTFDVIDVDVAVAWIVGGGLVVIRRILDGHLGPDADEAFALMALRSFNVNAKNAKRIAEAAAVRSTRAAMNGGTP